MRCRHVGTGLSDPLLKSVMTTLVMPVVLAYDFLIGRSAPSPNIVHERRAFVVGSHFPQYEN